MSNLTIYDVPENDACRDEIINNAMATIANYHRSQLPKSEAEIAMEATIEAVKAKNTLFTKIKPIP